MTQQKIPRLIIGGTGSGAGKTTVTTGLMASLSSAGYRVSPFKCGPDYIDPTYHRAATGRPSHNLDTWWMQPPLIRSLFCQETADADIALIEGVMGLFDGASAGGEVGSSAALAKELEAPVVLVVDAGGMSRSVAAMVQGYRDFDPDLHLAGVIFNRVGSRHHYQLLAEAVRPLKVEPLGYLPQAADLSLPERHLGLVPAQERAAVPQWLRRNEELTSEHIAFDRLLELAASAPAVRVPAVPTAVRAEPVSDPPIRIGLAYDQAFHFYYQAALDWLEQQGVEWVTVRPTRDEHLPARLDGLYLGGGFPEIFVSDLSQNQTFRRELKQAAQNGMPVYGECGGYMYLGEHIQTEDGRYPMAGVLPHYTEVTGRLQGMGYRTAKPTQHGPGSGPIKGHVFHYSKAVLPGGRQRPLYQLYKSSGRFEREDGSVQYRTYGTYLHSHFRIHPQLGEWFLNLCRRYQKEKSVK